VTRVAAAMALGTAIREWAAALVVAAGVLLFGTIAGLVGWGKRVKEPPETTRRTIKGDVQWGQERIARTASAPTASRASSRASSRPRSRRSPRARTANS